MHFKLLSDKDLKAMDALLDSYGGAKEISRKIESMRDYENRKSIAEEKGFGDMLKKAEEYVKKFAKVEDFIETDEISVTRGGICTTQVSGFQGARPTFGCIKRIAENGDILFPTEMISVVGLTETIPGDENQALTSRSWSIVTTQVELVVHVNPVPLPNHDSNKKSAFTCEATRVSWVPAGYV